MSFKTTSYFFPSNCHRMNKAKIDNTILSEYKRQIKNHLSCFINTTQFGLSRPQTRKSVKHRRYTAMSIGKSQSDKKHSETIIKEEEDQKLCGQSLSIFKLLQNAKKLKREDESMKDNPFYKIQKKRLLKNKLTPQIYHETKQKIKTIEESSLNSSKMDKQLFHNESLSKMVANQPKTRMKSETVTYYEIKSYYEQKYGKKFVQVRTSEETK